MASTRYIATTLFNDQIGLSSDGHLLCKGGLITLNKYGATASAATPAEMTDANENWLSTIVQTSATSGDSRGHYLRLHFVGAGVSGEALRAYGKVIGVTAAAGGTVNGAHISLAIEDDGTALGKVSGAGNALRTTLELGAGVAPGGTLSALLVDSYIAADATVPAGTAFIRFSNAGAGSLGYLFRVMNSATGGVLAPHVTDAMTHSIRCITDGGTAVYLMATTTATNRTDS